MATHRVHHGHNIKRLREIQGVKQTALALELGEGWNQKKVSVLESRPVISPELLQEVAAALGISTEAIEYFQETTVCKHLADAATPPPNHLLYGGVEMVGKLWELVEENRALYHSLLQAEKEKNQLLERLLSEKICELSGNLQKS